MSRAEQADTIRREAARIRRLSDEFCRHENEADAILKASIKSLCDVACSNSHRLQHGDSGHGLAIDRALDANRAADTILNILYRRKHWSPTGGTK